MERNPVVAGRFYQGGASELFKTVDQYLALAKEKRNKPTILAMVPHAGYPYSGGVCGATLASANLPETIILLGPNHTGLGKKAAVWPDGRWLIPGGHLDVDRELAAGLVNMGTGFEADRDAHSAEHSLEVVLPFLYRIDPQIKIVPVTVSERSPDILLELGRTIYDVAQSLGRDAAIVVSSDMSHYLPQERANKLDSLAVDQVLKLDPLGLYRTVAENNISMCGVLPMVIGLSASKHFGAGSAELIAYCTSGDVTGDKSQVVGYAGVVID